MINRKKKFHLIFGNPIKIALLEYSEKMETENPKKKKKRDEQEQGDNLKKI